jgi:cytidine deaminase
LEKREKSSIMDRITLNRMIEAAGSALARARAPVSGFPVGAAVLTRSGNIYAGCNTESIIAGLGVCAERSAMDHAVVHGENEVAAVLVTSLLAKPLFPCGACRQYLYEFAQPAGLDPVVYALGAGGGLEHSLLSDLLPHAFGPAEKASAPRPAPSDADRPDNEEKKGLTS